ncbi:hypothetical protein PUNSTDRAFT_119065 [Punctularia strigosozonata HHB-11173 SS5]|uniref:uncharacterized protein n=1 Tax=Punctularia strigosozonata (strain HHB-11173) TaxID=741275 RepID=UPI0004416738|nr:uncharacterized protein PUNSTDRAFT_119065 [Punctularia strigosozonata HHB-11173 SS5]EIN11838.1 hypothetical protein PUNSTDRAFT_119065 [Punctularia strigosozonata HHB-11173 SS5]
MPSTLPASNPYTVHMADSGNSGIIINRTDASADRWPKQVKEPAPSGLPSTASTNHFEVAVGTPQESHWKRAIGKFLAKQVLIPAGYAVKADRCVLISFPEGYKLFTHKKGDNYDWRTDCYLCGSLTVNRFRSPAEFFFHAKWLAEGKPTTSSGRTTCQCTYCDNTRTQGEISATYSNYKKAQKRVSSTEGTDDEQENPASKRKRGTTAETKKKHKAAPAKPIMAKDYRDMNRPDSPPPAAPPV